jgi:hypothetical protein
MEMNEITNGMAVRHKESGEEFTVASAPFWFDGQPTVTLQDKKGHARMTRLSALEPMNKNTEDACNE